MLVKYCNRNRHVKICSKSVLFVHVVLYEPKKKLSTEACVGKNHFLTVLITS